MNPRPDFLIGGQLPVFRIGFGAARLHGAKTWGEPDDRAAAAAVLRRAVQLGVNLIDTAEAYGPFASEALIAETLRPYPPDLTIATKGGILRTWPAGVSHPVMTPQGTPEALRRSVHGSLDRLGLPCIALYQLHRVDPTAGLERSMEALVGLKEEGLIRHIGLSEVTLQELKRAQAVGPVAAIQNRYSILDREYEKELRYCEDNAIAFLPWYPLAQGRVTQNGGALATIASRHGATLGQIAIAWLLQRSPVLIPIPGTTSIQHLEENSAAGSLSLSKADLALLDADA